MDECIAFRDGRSPGLRGAQLIGAEVCQYENSSNGDFLIDLHPSLSNVLLVGRYAAARLFGGVAPEPKFSLATKGETQNREVH